MARGGRVHPARLRHRAGLHRRDALRLPHRGGHDRRPENWMDEKGFAPSTISAASRLPRVTEWKHLDLNYKIVARINREKCIGCDLCYIACWDGAHQCIHLDGHAKPEAARSGQPRASPSRPSPSSMRRRSQQTPPECAFRASMRTNAWAAISAGWSARWRTASPWSRWKPAEASRVVGNAERN
jgi:ferredoxin